MNKTHLNWTETWGQQWTVKGRQRPQKFSIFPCIQRADTSVQRTHKNKRTNKKLETMRKDNKTCGDFPLKGCFPLPITAPSRQTAWIFAFQCPFHRNQRRHKCDKFQSCISMKGGHPPKGAFFGFVFAKQKPENLLSPPRQPKITF